MIFYALLGLAAVVAVLAAAAVSLFLPRHGEAERPGAAPPS
jgi:uncharacterized membrane protein YuzA (DUF378 family)